jgi:SAM-dependent MidA family methyltransferase
MQNGPNDPPVIRVSEAALAHSQALTNHLRELIARAGGWLPFHQWMAAVLYTPDLGYYAAGQQKISLRHDKVNPGTPAGDFVTSPELSAAFGYTLAQQVAQVLTSLEHNPIDPPCEPRILEFGAGSGQLADDVLTALDRLGLKAKYDILEVSADLRSRQQEKLQKWSTQVRWLNEPPASFSGVVIANEVLDAMPVHLVGWGSEGQVFERGVIWGDQGFAWADQPASGLIRGELANRMPPLPGYLTELNLAGEAWVRDLSRWLTHGIALLIDYGFTGHEYFHPQRHRGTLMCHIQHRAHDDPFFAPGLQDITAHVDFSAMASAAHGCGLEIMGYTSQARFLLNSGLPEQLSNLDQKSLSGIQTLVSEAEMGELFKVLAVGRGVAAPLIGFSQGDRRGHL